MMESSSFSKGVRDLKVDKYDGQTIWVCKKPRYELVTINCTLTYYESSLIPQGNYLGGGAAGV
jgi:hypothetical protein